jgi:hypothetical protein
MQRQRNRGVESNLFHQFLPPSDFLYKYVDAKIIQTCELSNKCYFSLWQALYPSWNVYEKFVYVTERSRQKHDKNVWEWSHVLGEGMDFQAKEWSFLFSNILI